MKTLHDDSLAGETQQLLCDTSTSPVVPWVCLAAVNSPAWVHVKEQTLFTPFMHIYVCI